MDDSQDVRYPNIHIPDTQMVYLVDPAGCYSVHLMGGGVAKVRTRKRNAFKAVSRRRDAEPRPEACLDRVVEHQQMTCTASA